MTVRITWLRAAIAAAVLGALGLLYAWSGAFNVAASSGHWPITNWFLHWVMRNSVETRSALTAPKDAADATGLVSAAGHFAAACASCHGAPGVRPSPVMQRATPHAPDLSVNAREWSDRQLFWILQHGVKYTGMPAWGAKDRPDEIRRMVAFVRRLPVMTPAQYRALSSAAAGAGTTGTRGIEGKVLDGCIACHGADGRGRGQPDIPVLGGQDAAYLRASLLGYARGQRQSAVMGNAAAAIDDATLARLAAHFSALPGLRGSGYAPPRAPELAAAARIVSRGLPDQQLPACASCHDRPGRSIAPRLSGQKASYIAQRLRHWRAPEGVIDARLRQDPMPVIARRIPEELIDPLARYLSGE